MHGSGISTSSKPHRCNVHCLGRLRHSGTCRAGTGAETWMAKRICRSEAWRTIHGHAIRPRRRVRKSPPHGRAAHAGRTPDDCRAAQITDKAFAVPCGQGAPYSRLQACTANPSSFTSSLPTMHTSPRMLLHGTSYSWDFVGARRTGMNWPSDGLSKACPSTPRSPMAFSTLSRDPSGPSVCDTVRKPCCAPGDDRSKDREIRPAADWISTATTGAQPARCCHAVSGPGISPRQD
ncbi:Uncharacterised protein [Delftia tsuruhatensis]|nr:Uncharacterised protein [Delftia tsuruhatensis]CAC9688068.1 Uncharacterised protein [Delftia tsuruhatensis]